MRTPYGTSSADGEVDAVVRSEPPTQRATLNGWVALAEWLTPAGERMLVLMAKPEASLLQMKAYMHSGLLNMVWQGYGEPEGGSAIATELRIATNTEPAGRAGPRSAFFCFASPPGRSGSV